MCNSGFESVRLVSGGWTCEILPSFGMNAISLSHNGREILRKPDSLKTLTDNPYVFGIPLLFPANRTKGGTFAYEGKRYELPINEPSRGNHIHGLMYNAPFSVVSKDEKSVKAVYENRSEKYPFAFRMTVTDAVSDKGYERKIEIENTSGASFPYTMAFHTSFMEPKILKAPVKERFLCDENYIPVGRRVPLTDTERQYRTGIPLKNHALSGFYVSGGESVWLDDVCFTVSDNFDELVLFNAGGGKGFVCVEPQAGEVNGLNTLDGCRILEKGETHVFSLSITQEEKA